MWIVIHLYTDDDYKEIESGVRRVWGPFAKEIDAHAYGAKVTRNLVRKRLDGDDTPFTEWVEIMWPERQETPEDLDDLNDCEVTELHEQLFQGEFIPGSTEWCEVTWLCEPTVVA